MLLPTFFAALVLTTATQAKITTHTTTLVINAYYDATANTVATSISTTSFTLSTPLFLAPAPTEEAARQTIDGYTIKVAASTSEAIQQPVSEYIIVVGDSTHKATQQVIQQTITDLAITRTSDQTSSQLTSQPTSTTTTTLTTEPIQQTTTTLIVSTHTNTSPTKPAEPTPPATWIFPATATLLLYDLVTMALFVWCWVMGMFSWWRRDGRAGRAGRRGREGREDWTRDDEWEGWEGERERRIEREMRRAGML